MERDYFRRQVQRYLAGIALSSGPEATPKEADYPKQTARQII